MAEKEFTATVEIVPDPEYKIECTNPDCQKGSQFPDLTNYFYDRARESIICNGCKMTIKLDWSKVKQVEAS